MISRRSAGGLVLVITGSVTVILACGSNVNFQSSLTVAGLMFDAFGAILVLASDASLLKKHFVPEDELDHIQTARDNLFDNLVVQRGEPGYEGLLEVIEENFDIENPPDCLTYDKTASGVAQTNSRVSIYGHRKNGDFSDNELDLSNSEWKSELDNNFTENKVAPAPLFDSRVNQFILNTEQRSVQTPLYFGAALLLLGFTLQLIATASTIVSFGVC